MEYSDLCKPQLLDRSRKNFWGFWGQCHNDYHDTGPHEGYEIIDQWAERFRHSPMGQQLRAEVRDSVANAMEPYVVKDSPGAFFVFTSNVDAHHFDWFRAEEIRECHGNTELYQCANNSQIESSPCYGRVWRSPRNFRFCVDRESMKAPPGEPCRSTEQALQENLRVREGAEPARVGHVRGGGRPHLLRYMPDPEADMAEKFAVGFESNHPKCVFCGEYARPAIQMFKDREWTDVQSQRDRWAAWLSSVQRQAKIKAEETGRPLKVAILEIGCGEYVTTVRETAEEFVTLMTKQGASARLIRVNPQHPLADVLRPEDVVSVMGCGLETIRKIDSFWSALWPKTRPATVHKKHLSIAGSGTGTVQHEVNEGTKAGDVQEKVFGEDTTDSKFSSHEGLSEDSTGDSHQVQIDGMSAADKTLSAADKEVASAVSKEAAMDIKKAGSSEIRAESQLVRSRRMMRKTCPDIYRSSLAAVFEGKALRVAYRAKEKGISNSKLGGVGIFPVKKEYVKKFGSTPKCFGCMKVEGKFSYPRAHNAECRKRMMSKVLDPASANIPKVCKEWKSRNSAKLRSQHMDLRVAYKPNEKGVSNSKLGGAGIFRVMKEHVKKFGSTPKCYGCIKIEKGYTWTQSHNAECRARIMRKLHVQPLEYAADDSI